MVFEELKKLVPLFHEDLIEYEKIIEKKIIEKRNEGYEKISLRNMSMKDIEREEAALEKSLEIFRQEERRIFSKNYILNRFGSHEDAFLRNYTNQALVERHQLSSLFSKSKENESSEERILNIVISSVNILKNGIIDLQLRKLMTELKGLESGKPELEREIHAKIGEILQMRSRMAKDIGDRILDPNSIKNKNINPKY